MMHTAWPAELIEVSESRSVAEQKTIKRMIEVETEPDQSWFWAEEWQAGEREADAQIAAGEELLAALEVEHQRLLREGR